MRLLTSAEASTLLATRGLKIGAWNELVDLDSAKAAHRQCVAPADTRTLISFARSLLEWLCPQQCKWIILQIDNSTAPLLSEPAVFQFLAMPDLKNNWDVGTQRTFMFNVEDTDDGNQAVFKTRLSMLIFIALAFEWHVHFACDTGAVGQRLALLDGVAYLFGPENSIRAFQT